MPAGKLVFSGMEFVKSSRCGSSVRISVWRGTNTGGNTGETGKNNHTLTASCKLQVTKTRSATGGPARSQPDTHARLRIITGRLHSLVVVGVDAHFILLEVEGKLAGIDGPQLVVTVQVGPPPQAAVDDVGQTLTVGHLETPVQGPDVVGQKMETEG